MHLPIMRFVFAATLSMQVMADDPCDQADRQLDYTLFLGEQAHCSRYKADFCHHMEKLDASEYDALLTGQKTRSASGNGSVLTLSEVFASCGLDYDQVHYRQCQKAFRGENLAFILEYCPGEAWSLARAQCERHADTVSERYRQFCDRFYNGAAPGPGEQSRDY